jgi:hypothetical protein
MLRTRGKDLSIKLNYGSLYSVATRSSWTWLVRIPTAVLAR